MGKDNRILELETQISKCGFISPAAGTSDLAKRRKEENQHRDKLNALQKQLDTTNKRLKDSNITRNQFVVDLEHKTRECRFFENRCDELQNEKHNLIARLEVISNGEGSNPVKCQNVRSQTLRDHLQYAKDELRLREEEIDDMRRELEEVKLRNNVLENALDFRADEIGLSGHADMLCKVAGFRGEVTALKNDLLEKRNKLHDIEAERQSVNESNLTLKQQVTQLQERLTQSRSELQRMQKGESLMQQLVQAESERDVLLEYVQDDLRNNSDLTLAVDKAMKEASEAQRTLDMNNSQLKRQSELVDSQSKRIADLEMRQSALVEESATARDRAMSGLREMEDLKARLIKKELESEEMSKVHISLLQQVWIYPL